MSALQILYVRSEKNLSEGTTLPHWQSVKYEITTLPLVCVPNIFFVSKLESDYSNTFLFGSIARLSEI